MSLWISETVVLPLAYIDCARIGSIPCDLCLFSFSMAI